MKDTTEKLKQRLLGRERPLPTGMLGRWGRAAGAAVRAGWFARAGSDPSDIEGLAKMVEALGELKGLAMKAGQIMSYVDVALPDEVRSALAALQTHSPPMPLELVKRVIRRELRSEASSVLEHLHPEPIAAASIGQVHLSTLRGGRQVAVKVQYPGIERAIESDFGPTLLAGPMAALAYPGARVEALVAEAKRRLLEECDYRLEAERQRAFGQIYAQHPTIIVPAVVSRLSAKRVLTSEYIEGASFEEFLGKAPSQAARDRVGAALFEFYFGTLFSAGLYNGDPHPGNVLLTARGELAMLDYGCCRQFDAPFVAGLVALGEAVARDDVYAMQGALEQLGVRPVNGSYDARLTRELLHAFFGPMREDRVQRVSLGAGAGLRDVFTRKRQMMRWVWPGEFLFLFRLRFGLLSVLARLEAEANWFQLESQAMERGRAWLRGG